MDYKSFNKNNLFFSSYNWTPQKGDYPKTHSEEESSNFQRKRKKEFLIIALLVSLLVIILTLSLVLF